MLDAKAFKQGQRVKFKVPTMLGDSGVVLLVLGGKVWCKADAGGSIVLRLDQVEDA